jgi:predicted alpha/beta hydrolase
MNSSDIKIKSDNQVELSATVFYPTQVKGAVMIGGATGIKKRFYYSFASFLADHGYGVIVFDYDGIGDSKNGNVRHSNASLVSWGQSDLSAVFETLKKLFPNVKYHLAGHSAGGQLVGLMKGALELTSLFNVACSSGSLRNMKFPFKWKAHFFMNVFIPVNNLLFGYTHSPWVGMGEPLPKKAAQQWAAWCNSQGYVKKYIDNHTVSHFYHDMKCPSLWINATDDDIAIDENVDDMIRVFPQLPAEKLTIVPADYHLPEVGHMKFFAKQSRELWTIALNWFNRY